MQNSRSTALNGMELHTMLCVRMYVCMDGCTYECVCVCAAGKAPAQGIAGENPVLLG
jgi:hypothetical protein